MDSTDIALILAWIVFFLVDPSGASFVAVVIYLIHLFNIEM